MSFDGFMSTELPSSNRKNSNMVVFKKNRVLIMSIEMNNKPVCFIAALLLALLALLGAPLICQAQEAATDVLGPEDLRGGMPIDQALQAEIDKVLGMTESKIKKGIVDPGVDVMNLMVNKALDEMIKAIADAVVVAPAAEKIMSIYQKTKDKRLVKKIASLRQVWKDGQERLNKLNYQDFKLRYEWALQHNQENEAIKESSIKGIE